MDFHHRRCSYEKSSLATGFKFFLFILFQTLLHFLAHTENSIPLFSSDSTLFRKNTGSGGGTLIFPTINAFSSARSPRALPLTLAPAPTYNPAVSPVASQSNSISGSNRMKKSFWMCAVGIFVLLGQAARLAAQAPERESKASEAKAAEKCDPATAKEESSDRKSTRLNSSHVRISYAVFCLKQKTN